MRKKNLLFVSFLFAFLPAFNAAETEWPQFLGPKRNGAIQDESFVQAWLRAGLSELWRLKLGEGYSGIVTKNNRIFTMDSDGKDEFVLSIDASSGKILWRVKAGTSPDDVYGGLGPRVTPSIMEDRLFTVNAQGDLIALNTNTGEIIWKRELASDLGWRPPAEGTTCSPLIADGRIYLMIGGSDGKAVAAFDSDTGKTLWTSQNDRTSYSSAVRWDFAEIQQVLFLAGSTLFSVEAASGKLIWKYPWPTYDSVNVATPLIIGTDRVFISSGYDQGAAMLQIKMTKNKVLDAIELWRNREMKNHFNNSVYHEGVLYGFDNAIFKAVNADTGQALWKESGMGKGSVILAGTYLVVLSEGGELICAKTSRKKFTIAKRLSILSGKCWTPPSLTNNHLFVRNQKEIVCLAPSAVR